MSAIRTPPANDAFRSNFDEVFRRDSSEVERPVFNREVSGSSPDHGSSSNTPVTTYVYMIARTELSGGAAVAYALHAGRECKGPPPSPDERSRVLSATKEQLNALAGQLAAQGTQFHTFTETDGELAGSSPFIVFSTANPEYFQSILKHLKSWKAPKAGGWNEAIDAVINEIHNAIGADMLAKLRQLKR